MWPNNKKRQGFATFTAKKHRDASSTGGKKRNPNKGFGSLSPEQRSKNGSRAAKLKRERARNERQRNETAEA